MLDLGAVAVVHRPATLRPARKCLVDVRLLKFVPLVLESSFKSIKSVCRAFLQTALKDTPDAIIHRGTVRALWHPLRWCNVLHPTFLKKIKRFSRSMTGSGVLMKHDLEITLEHPF